MDSCRFVFVCLFCVFFLCVFFFVLFCLFFFFFFVFFLFFVCLFFFCFFFGGCSSNMFRFLSVENYSKNVNHGKGFIRDVWYEVREGQGRQSLESVHYCF